VDEKFFPVLEDKMSAATDCLSYDPKNNICMEGLICGECKFYFSEKDLQIPANIEDAEIPEGVVE
jgi:hypothetical protein